MSSYNDYPVTINSTQIPVAVSWQETFDVVETVNVTEAGTDIVDVQRVDKLTVTASFGCSSTWMTTFKGWANATSKLTVKIYDHATSGYITRYMRMRNFSASLVPNSDKTSGTIGLWDVSFDLVEF